MTGKTKFSATDFAFDLGSLNNFPQLTKALVEDDRETIEK